MRILLAFILIWSAPNFARAADTERVASTILDFCIRGFDNRQIASCVAKSITEVSPPAIHFLRDVCTAAVEYSVWYTRFDGSRPWISDWRIQKYYTLRNCYSIGLSRIISASKEKKKLGAVRVRTPKFAAELEAELVSMEFEAKLVDKICAGADIFPGDDVNPSWLVGCLNQTISLLANRHSAIKTAWENEKDKKRPLQFIFKTLNPGKPVDGFSDVDKVSK